MKEVETNPLEGLNEEREQAAAEGTTPVRFVTGCAGSGKTFSIKQKNLEDPTFARLCATTGIAGVNLGTSTINSELGYFDTESLRDGYSSGWVQKRLRRIAEQVAWFGIDEISMMPRQQLDILHMALTEVNESRAESDKLPLGLILTGDFAQLPPIPGPLYKDGKQVINPKTKFQVKEPTPWAFNAECWSEFDSHTIKLTKIWRQDNPQFLSALNAIRRGAGTAGVSLLTPLIEWLPRLDRAFDGTTIMAKNEEVDRYNNLRLMELTGDKFSVTSTRWWATAVQGRKQPGEWNNIPERLDLKVGALVMLLDNKKDPEFPEEFLYCNGDLAHIEELIYAPQFDLDEYGEPLALPSIKGELTGIGVKLIRSGREVVINRITRAIEQKHEPEEPEIRSFPKVRQGSSRTGKKVWILGEVNFFPIRLAYATTVHKSQGLSLDSVMIDPSSHFFGNAQMAYVALSRCRTPEGLKVVGKPAGLAGKVKVDENIRRFL